MNETIELEQRGAAALIRTRPPAKMAHSWSPTNAVVSDPEPTRIALAELGCVPPGDTLQITGKRITLEELPAWADRADDVLAVVLPGAEKIRLESVERDPDD